MERGAREGGERGEGGKMREGCMRKGVRVNSALCIPYIHQLNTGLYLF